MNSHKLVRLRAIMLGENIQALLLNRASNFAWLTDGAASYINMATDTGAASLLVTADRQYMLCDNIEAPRLESEEELSGWEFVVGPWSEGRETLVRSIVPGALHSDSAFPGANDVADLVSPLRHQLDALEVARFRELGEATARAAQNAARAVRPGLTEHAVAGLLAEQAYANGIVPIVVLIATDDRISRFRHPLPTGRKVERYVMLVICGRRCGLVASATRLIHFGDIPSELRRRADACAHVDAAIIEATRRGGTLGDVFQAAMRAYARQGFEGEWKKHHQGGLAGYEPREVVATPSSKVNIVGDQAFAWNPSITGTKSEDTILRIDAGIEIVTQADEWPTILADGFRRPDILHV